MSSHLFYVFFIATFAFSNSLLAQPTPGAAAVEKPAQPTSAAAAIETPAQPTPGAASVEASAQPSAPGASVPPSAAQVEPQIEAQSSFTLENSLSLRDPFRRPKAKPVGGSDEGGTIPELERFEIDKFKLLGIITGPKKNKALVAVPGGKMHVVSENVRIGTRQGTVKRIAPGVVTVEEKVVNLLGQEEKIESTIEFENKDQNKDKDKGAL